MFKKFRNNPRKRQPGLAKKLYSVFMSAMMVASLVPSGASTALASVSDSVAPGTYGQYTYSQSSTKNAFEDSEYDGYRDPVATKWLGIAGSFHITAFNEVNIGSHVYGNILTKTLNGSNNFGPSAEYGGRYGYQTLSYIQNYPTPSGNPDGKTEGVFVIGSDNTVTAVDNNNHLAINGTQLNSPNTLVQDTDTSSAPFIDLDAVKTYADQKSEELAQVSDGGASITTDGGNTYINYEGDSGCAYVTMTAEDLNRMDQLFIKGMALNGECSVVINVQMDGATELNLSKVHVLNPDGSKAGTGETDSTVGYVLFNIVGSTSDMSINLSDQVLASVLAPNSTINLGGSAAGTYIATNVNVTAESHARPFRGTLKPITTSAKASKVWLDAYGNAERYVEHEAVKVQLYQRKNDGDWTEYGDEVELSDANDWSYDWGSSLPKKDTDGSTYEYKVEEVSKAVDYDSTVTETTDGWTITNRHVAVGRLYVKKYWSDNDDKDKIRPNNVIVRVVRSTNGTDFEQYGESLTLDYSNDWYSQVIDLPLKDADGNAYIYKVEEDVPEGYSASYEIESSRTDADGNEFWVYNVTNTHTTTYKETSVDVTKVWEDAAGNAESGEHQSVTVQLYQSKNGEAAAAYGDPVTLSEGNWSYRWDGLVQFDGEGNTYTYTVDELNVPEGYARVVTGQNNAFTITNKKIASVSVKAVKTWSDNDDVDQMRPTELSVSVNQVSGTDGASKVVGTLKLSASNNWTAQLDGLAEKDSAGNAYTYTLTEANVEGYTGKVSDPVKTTDDEGNSVWAFSLTNTHEQKKTSVKVTKEWDDADDHDGLRPGEVTVNVLRSVNGGRSEVVRTLILNEANDWAATVSDLPVNGKEGAYTYSVSEVEVAGYESKVSTEQASDGSYSFKLINTHEVEKTAVNVKKVWDDRDDFDKIRPKSVAVTLCTVDAEGDKVPVEGKSVVLDESNQWGAGWSDLPVYADGQKINYTVEEAEVDGYTAKVSDGISTDDGKSFTFTITNTHDVEDLSFGITGYSVASVTELAQPDNTCYVDPKIYKVLEGRQLQKGEFTFELVYEGETEEGVSRIVSTQSNDEAGMVDFDKNNLAPEGMDPCCLKFTKAGTYSYVVREVSADKDATVNYSDEVVKFVVDVYEQDGKLVSDGGRYIYYKSSDSTMGVEYASNDHPTITNSTRGIIIALNKVNGSGEGLAGATYGLYTKGADGNAELVLTATSNAGGAMTFGATSGYTIQEGAEYWFAEICAPAGYKRSYAESKHFTVGHTKAGYYLADLDGNQFALSSGESLAIAFGEDMVDEQVGVVLNKVDSAASGLSGARLSVKNASSGAVVDSWTSNGAGHKLSGIATGVTYVLHEESAPEGYTKAADVEFTVSESGAVSIVSGGTTVSGGKSVVNAFQAGDSVSLIDYRETELVERKEIKREKTEGSSAVPKTGDTSQSPTILIVGAVVVIAAAAILWLRARK